MTNHETYTASKLKLNTLRNAKADYIHKAVELARNKAHNEACAQFDADIQAAWDESTIAEAAWLTEKESEATKNAPHPIGTKYLRWEKELHYWSRTAIDKPLKWIATGETALLEVVTRESKFADNLSSYSVPEVGSLILRVNKKNGEPGLKFVQSGAFMPRKWDAPTWYPEGEDPNQAEESARRAKEKQKAEEWMNNPTLCPK